MILTYLSLLDIIYKSGVGLLLFKKLALFI